MASCLYRLGRHQEAADEYLRVSVATSADRAGLLFDIGLNWLAAGDADRAGDAYAQGFAALAGLPKAERRRTLEVGARDLREALTVGQIAETEQVRELSRRLTGPAGPESATGVRAAASRGIDD